MPPASAPLLWLGAAAVGLAAAALGYWPFSRRTAAPAALRGLAVMLGCALLLDAPAAAGRARAALVAVDASASARRGLRAPVWRAAAARAGAGAVAFGDSVRPLAADSLPADAHSSLRAAVDRAAAEGRPLHVVTDGELDDADATLPAGSSVELLRAPPAHDVAVADLVAPRAVAAGDTVRGTLRVVADSGGSTPRDVTLLLDGRPAARAAVGALGPYAAATVSFSLVAPARGPVELRAALAPGDDEPRDDSLGVALEISDAAAAVSVSTAPDYDWRYATALLREASAVPVRGYVRVAPGAWRDDATLSAVPESEVRARVRSASLLVLHGDTAAFGAPASATRGALVLLPTTRAADEGEWYAGAAPPSPLAAALASAPWDSLPPLGTPAGAGRSDWVGLTVRLARRDEAVPAVVGRESGRHAVVVLASGLWRWRFRGGVAAQTYGALWGSIFDWAAAEPASSARLAIADPLVRRGDPLRWRRGPGVADSVTVNVTRRGAASRTVPLPVTFAHGASVGESEALPEGVYDARAGDARLLLDVNPAREWLPRRPTRLVVSGGVVGVPAVGLRSFGWPFVVAVLLLCGEWVLRRRAGWR